MSSSSVWVQLYYEGENEPKGRPVEIEPIPKNIDALAKAVKAELRVALSHCDPAALVVYPPDTEWPFSEQAFIRGDKILQELIDELGSKTQPVSIDYDHPLIVVAPARNETNVADTKEALLSTLPVFAETTAEKVFEKMEIASSSINFSNVKRKQYEKVTNLLRFKIKGATWKHNGRIPATQTRLHTWLDGNEDSPENIQAYMNYVNLEWRPKFRWKDEHEYVDCNEKGAGLKSLLDTHHFDGQHSTSGNIDVVLVESPDKAANAIKNNIELGLELKHTKNAGEHERQVILQHLAASYLNHDHPVLTLMTDLSTRFSFYWFGKSEKIIWKYKASIAEAMYLLDHMFVKNDEMKEESDEEETFPIDFLIGERGTWDSFNTIIMETIHENDNEEDFGDDDSPSDANHQKEEEDTPGRKRDYSGKPVGEKKEQMHQGTSSSGERCIGNNYQLGQEDLSDVLGFDTLDEREKGEAVLEYLACNVLPNVVLT